MESSINSKSLMIGNVSTDESRKEIRNSPGAPSVPANATIFCFHPLSLPCNPRHPPLPRRDTHLSFRAEQADFFFRVRSCEHVGLRSRGISFIQQTRITGHESPITMHQSPVAASL